LQTRFQALLAGLTASSPAGTAGTIGQPDSIAGLPGALQKMKLNCQQR